MKINVLFVKVLYFIKYKLIIKNGLIVMNGFIHSAGRIHGEVPESRPGGWRRLKYDFLAVTCHGMATYRDDFSKAAIKEKGFVFVPSGKWHLYDPASFSHWVNCWLLFDACIAEKSFGRVVPKEQGAFPLERTDKLESLWEELIKVDLSEKDGSTEYCHFLAHNIFMKIFLQRKGIDFNSPGDIVSKALELMRRKLTESDIDFRRFAKNEGIGYDSFRKTFKLHTGMAPKQRFLDMKISAACSMLMDLSNNVSRISEKLGFKDQYYFSRLFKSKQGICPKNYRRDMIERRR